MRGSAGFTAAIPTGKTRLLEPLLLCESPEKVQGVLQVYLKQTRFRNSTNINLQIVECPSLIAVACLAKQNNVFADLAAQELLRQSLVWLKQELSATDSIGVSAAPSPIPGFQVLNVSASIQSRLRQMVMWLVKTTMEKAMAGLPGHGPK